MRTGRGRPAAWQPRQSMAHCAVVSLALLTLWMAGCLVTIQLKYLNHQGEGHVRRKKEIYSVEELGCDDCTLPPPVDSGHAVLADRADGAVDAPDTSVERTSSSSAFNWAEGGNDSGRQIAREGRPAARRSKGVAKQATLSREEMMARAAELREANKLPPLRQHEIKNAVGWSPSELSGTGRSVSGNGQHLRRPAILLLAYKRPAMLQATLESLSRLEGLQDFDVYLSQDGSADPKVGQLLKAAVKHGSGVLAPPRSRRAEAWTHVRELQKDRRYDHSYLTLHYGWALGRVFEAWRGHDAVVVVEDDMTFSPDFLLYFQATAALLGEDDSIWCISSWNDNGHQQLASNAHRLSRTSFFPGLGWLMPRKMWEEVGPKWPDDNWDFWLRREDVARGRDCIVPEVSRNFNRGDVGSNMGKDLYSKTLAKYAWSNGVPTRDFGDLSYLLREPYEARLRSLAQTATPHDWREHGLGGTRPGALYLLLYRVEEYAELAKLLPVWPVEPRGHHGGMAEVRFQHATFLLADVRACELLPDALREQPTPGLAPTLGRPMERSCAAVCRELAPPRRCSPRDFPWLGVCGVLAGAPGSGGCLGGCSQRVATEVPDCAGYLAGGVRDTRRVGRQGRGASVRGGDYLEPQAGGNPLPTALSLRALATYA
eukprot:jgi/Tetstr1/440036/TSEL_028395.t1